MKKFTTTAIASVIIMIMLGMFTYYSFINSKVDIAISSSKGINGLTMEQKIEDFNYLFEILKDNFPYFEVQKNTNQYDWLNQKNEFERLISETKNDYDYYSTLRKILRLIQNAHTDIMDFQEVQYAKGAYNNLRHLGFNPWSQVLNNLQVNEKYNYWESINKNTKRYIIPISFRYIEGKYVSVESEEYGIPDGSILLGIGNVTTDQYINSLKEELFLGFDFKRKKNMLTWLNITSKEKVEMDLNFVSPDGKNFRKIINTVEYQNLSESNNSSSSKNIYTSIFLYNKVAYLKINSFGYQFVKQDKEQIYEFLKAIKDYPTLIIDIRGNNGGSDEYWAENIVSPLISNEISKSFYIAFRNGKYSIPFLKSVLELSYIKKKSTKDLLIQSSTSTDFIKDFGYFISKNINVKPVNPVGFKGEIYLLVDNNVFSATETFAAFAKATKWAKLVGVTTGGDGIAIDPILVSLPNSGLIVKFSSVMSINPDNTINEENHTQPDIYIEQTYEDYMNFIRDQKNGMPISTGDYYIKYDTVIKYILNNT